MRKADAPRLIGLDVPDTIEVTPPLWKDLMFASVVAALLWAAAVVLFA